MKDVLKFTPINASLTISKSYIAYMIKRLFGFISNSCSIFCLKENRTYLLKARIVFILSYFNVYISYQNAWGRSYFLDLLVQFVWFSVL